MGARGASAWSRSTAIRRRVLNVGFYRWYGWDGAHDSLWSQSIRPLLDAREMSATPGARGRAWFENYCALNIAAAFGRDVPKNDEEVLVDVGKALAAFQETLVSGRTAVRRLPRCACRKGVDRTDYPAAAQRGLKIFVGKGNCSTCHFGPHFTNGEFADTGIPFFSAPGRVDAGRLEG